MCWNVCMSVCLSVCLSLCSAEPAGSQTDSCQLPNLLTCIQFHEHPRGMTRNATRSVTSPSIPLRVSWYLTQGCVGIETPYVCVMRSRRWTPCTLNGVQEYCQIWLQWNKLTPLWDCLSFSECYDFTVMFWITLYRVMQSRLTLSNIQ